MSAFIHSVPAFRRLWAACCRNEQAAEAIAWELHWRPEQGPRSEAIWRWMRALEAAQAAAVAHRCRDTPAALELPELPPDSLDDCGATMTPAGLVKALCSVEYQCLEGPIPDREPYCRSLEILANTRLAVALSICRKAPGWEGGVL